MIVGTLKVVLVVFLMFPFQVVAISVHASVWMGDVILVSFREKKNRKGAGGYFILSKFLKSKAVSSRSYKLNCLSFMT